MNTNDGKGDSRGLDDLVRAGEVAMLTTLDGSGRLSSRPLTIAEVHPGVLVFLIDVTAEWAARLREREQVNTAICAGSGNEWVSVSGRVAISTDRTTIERLWSPAATAFFDDVHDARLGALQVSLDDGEFWSAPGAGPIGRLISVLGAAIGREDTSGEHGEIARD